MSTAIAQTQPSEWENTKIFAINKESAHNSFLAYDNENIAKADDFSKSPWYMLLNGIWKFNWGAGEPCLMTGTASFQKVIRIVLKLAIWDKLINLGFNLFT